MIHSDAITIADQAVGRTQNHECRMDPARATALSAALNIGQVFRAGDVMPPFFHQIYFWDLHQASDHGRDGHTRIGKFVPDFGLRRRMWAGGRLIFHAPLLAGTSAQKRSIIESAVLKSGRTGPLALVTIRYEISQESTLKVTEYQDLVYRDEHDPGLPLPVSPKARSDEDSAELVTFQTSLLFRYSALTLNGHRIHYDQNYAQNVEGYDGLVVHGPLLVQLLILKAEAELGSLCTFSFRATAPLFQPEPATLCRKGADMWVRGSDGRQIMRASCTTS